MRSIYLTTRFPRQAYGVEYIYITLCVIVAVAVILLYMYLWLLRLFRFYS